jgi:hypothetical protein
MKTVTQTKPFLVSLLFLFVGVLSLGMENIFYGHIDQNGVLQESFFLPLGSFSLILGVVGFIISIIWFYLKRKTTPGSGPK